jgi:hypothetical protein
MRVRAAAGHLAEQIIGARGKKAVKYGLLRLTMAFGVEPFTAAGGIDRKLLAHLRLDRPGVFVEAGANDGFSHSNTFYLEQRLGWTGLLVEPIPILAAFARKIRTAPVETVALGPPEESGNTVRFGFNDLMSRPGADSNTNWAGWFGPKQGDVVAPLTTLSQLFDQHGLSAVDFLSLDIEGHPVLGALRGLDLRRHRPRFIMVEFSDAEQPLAILGSAYRFVEQMTPSDFLFAAV